jgi:hypothetical protein
MEDRPRPGLTDADRLQSRIIFSSIDHLIQSLQSHGIWK